MGAVYDGFVSRHINRKISDPLAKLLAKTKLTPNQATWIAFAIAALAAFSFFIGHNILAGILAQLSSIADGIDGSLARLKGMTSSFGGFFDSVVDRYADALVVLGMTYWSLNHESHPFIWLLGFLAIVGTMAVSYTRASLAAEHRTIFDRGLLSLASRDIRLFLIMLGSVAGQVYFCLLVIAVLTNGVVICRLAYSYGYLKARGK